MGAASAVGMGRFAIDKAVDYVKTRQVWKTPIGAHQGSHIRWRRTTSRSNWPS